MLALCLSAKTNVSSKVHTKMSKASTSQKSPTRRESTKRRRTHLEGNSIWQRYCRVGKDRIEALMRGLHLMGYTRQVFYKRDSKVPEEEITKIPSDRRELYIEILNVDPEVFRPACLKGEDKFLSDPTVNSEALKRSLKLFKP